MTRATTFRATAVIGGVLLAMLMIMTVSRAAFSDPTANDGNSFTAGNVELTDDDSDTAMFTINPMAPDQSETRCIKVTYSGNLTSNVVLSSLDASVSDQDFADALDIDVYSGATATGTFPYNTAADTCSGGTRISTLGNVLGDFMTPSGFADSWTGLPSPPTTTETYRFVIHFQDTIDNDLQDATAGFNVTWLATSTP